MSVRFHSKEIKEKMRLSHLGKNRYKKTEEHRKKISETLKRKGIRPDYSMKGRHLSEETKRRISLALKGRKIPHPKGHFVSEETRKRMSKIAFEKVKNGTFPSWKGGKTSVIVRLRENSKYKEWRKKVYERDGYTCVFCGNTNCRLEADHIIRFSDILGKLIFEQGYENLYEKALNYDLLWDVSNGRTLCKTCHLQTDTYGTGANKNVSLYVKRLKAAGKI
jgi:5-methylcytosine-specific restriction endonuclease McrA